MPTCLMHVQNLPHLSGGSPDDHRKVPREGKDMYEITM